MQTKNINKDEQLTQLLEVYEFLRKQLNNVDRQILNAHMDDYGNPIQPYDEELKPLETSKEKITSDMTRTYQAIIKVSTVNSLDFAKQMCEKLSNENGSPYKIYYKTINNIMYLCIGKKEDVKELSAAPISAGEIIVDADTKITKHSTRSTVVNKKTVTVDGKEVVVRITAFIDPKFKNLFKLDPTFVEVETIAADIIAP